LLPIFLPAVSRGRAKERKQLARVTHAARKGVWAMKIFWVESNEVDGWLTVAKNQQRAQGLHEIRHDLSPGAARATFVTEIPDHLEVNEGPASRQVLETCHVTVTIWQSPHLVEIAQ